ncbi:Histidine kinase (fragment) [Frankia canadensis]|uniref:Histidine kinase n=1 Tax=Frankia canadensis TaxID=1836972 RepID=A0A2I2L0R6_9ACTN
MIVPVSASDALADVVVRAFAVLRVLGIVTTALHLIVWRSWYGGHPVALAGGLLVEVWGLAYILLSTRRGLGTRLVLANVAVGAAAAVAAGVLLPPVSVGTPGTWVFLGCAHAALVAGCRTGRRLFALVLATLEAALLVGVACADRLAAALPGPATATATATATAAALPGHPAATAASGTYAPTATSTAAAVSSAVERAAADPGGGYRRAAVSIMLIVMLTALIRFGVGRLWTIAQDADTRLRAAADHLSAEAIAVARARAERERERVLHDTALNTLAGIAWGGGDDLELTRGQAADAIAAVDRLLRGPAGDVGDLDTRLDAVVAAARRRGLRVELGRTGAIGLAPGAPPRPSSLPGPLWAVLGPADPGPAPSGEAAGETGRAAPPREAVDALAAAVAELLSNVRRHAGTDEAWVTVHRTPSAVGIEVRDEGCGFDPAAVPADRLGLSRSVLARVADAGGRDRVDAMPGRGTRVLLTWAVPVPAGQTPAGAVPAGPGAADPSRWPGRSGPPGRPGPPASPDPARLRCPPGPPCLPGLAGSRGLPGSPGGCTSARRSGHCAAR